MEEKLIGFCIYRDAAARFKRRCRNKIPVKLSFRNQKSIILHSRLELLQKFSNDMEIRYRVTTLLALSLDPVVSLSILDRSASVEEDRWRTFVATFVSISFNFVLRILRRSFSPSGSDACVVRRTLTTCWQRERRAARRPGSRRNRTRY